MTKNYLNTQSSLAMKSEGYYSAKTVGAKNAIDKTQKLIENALNTIPKKEKIADTRVNKLKWVGILFYHPYLNLIKQRLGLLY